jgi:hypothetical protein
VLFAQGLEWPAVFELFEDQVRIYFTTLERCSDGSVVAEVFAIVVARGEQREMRGEEMFGEPVAHHESGCKCRELVATIRVFPDRKLVKGRSSVKCRDDVLVRVSGKRTPVVKVDRKGLRSHGQ